MLKTFFMNYYPNEVENYYIVPLCSPKKTVINKPDAKREALAVLLPR